MLLLLRVPSTGDRVGAIDPPTAVGLAAAAVRRAGYPVDVLDLTWEGNAGIDRLMAALADDGLRVIGMAAYQTNIERCIRIAGLVRSVRPDIRILLGGPQATHMPAEGLAAMPHVDGLCRGAAERVLPDYLRALSQGHDDLRGFLHRRGDGFVDGGRPAPPTSLDLESSPFDGTLWPLDRYPFVVMFASRGCPYDCAFCYTPAATGRRMTYAPIERVLRDVAAVAAAGVKHVFFADPIFVVDRKRTLALLRALGELRAGVSMSCELRFEHVDHELLEALARAGFAQVSYGLESADPAVLARARKPMDLQRFRTVVEMTLAHGIAAELFYLYGLPGDSYDSVRRTFDFVASFAPIVDEISEPQQVQLYFGTDLLDHCARFGIEPIGTRPAYLSPGTNFRTATLGPDDFAALEGEWRGRRAHRPQAAASCHAPS